MPRLPVVDIGRRNLRALNQPEASPRDFGAGVGVALAGLGEELADLQERKKPIETAKAAGEYDLWAEEAKNRIQTQEDPNTWEPTFLKEEAEFRRTQSEAIEDNAVRGASELHRTKQLPNHILDVRKRAVTATKEKQLGDIEITGNVLAKQAAQTDDPELRRSYMATFNSMLAGASMPAVVGGRPVTPTLGPKEVEVRREKWNVDVLKNRMEMLALSPTPGDFTKLNNEHTSGAYAMVPPDERARILERGRTHQESLYNSVERQKNEGKRIVENDWSARANFGLITDDEMTRALRGEHPLLSATRARELKSVNDNPPGGEGGDSVRVIMTKYAAGEPTIARVRAARKELNDFQAATGRSSEVLKDAFLKLQSDQRTMETIDVQRTNRAVTAARDTFQAEAPPLFSNSPLWKNMRNRDEAWIADQIRKGMDPKKAVEAKTKQTEQRKNAIPERQRKVLELK